MLFIRSLIPTIGLFCLIACKGQPQSRKEIQQNGGDLQSLQPGTHVFAKGGLRLRAEPDEKSQVITLIPELAQVKVPGEEKHSVEFDNMHGKEAPWVPATFQDKKGFVSRDFLKTILSAVTNRQGTIQVLEVVSFPGSRGEYMLESEFYLRYPEKLVKLPGRFRETSPPFWMDDRFIIFRTHFGDGGAGSDDIYQIDTETKRIEFLHGSYYSMIETGHCNEIKSCVCGGHYYRYLKHTYYLESDEKQTSVYVLPEYPHEENAQCKHGIPRKIMRKIAIINEPELKYNSQYYQALQFTSGNRNFTVQTDGVTIK